MSTGEWKQEAAAPVVFALRRLLSTVFAFWPVGVLFGSSLSELSFLAPLPAPLAMTKKRT